MKSIKLIIIALLFGCKNDKEISTYNNLTIIKQDYNKALKTALKENKLLFIDFYTTWCSPCKKLDEIVFQNDSIKKILKKDFILLQYNAENDSIFHLSKKHHVSSYPTGIILNKNGYVLNRKYGFPGGEDFDKLTKSVFEFTSKGIKLNKKNKILKGYSNKINASKYPPFYVNYVNRTNIKIDSSEINEYLNKEQDIFSEEYFSTLIYFAGNISNKIADIIIRNKKKYIALYGKTNMDVLMLFLISGKFDRAIAEKSQKKYEEAIRFTKRNLNEKRAKNMLISFKKDFLKAQGKWNQVFQINENLRKNGKFSNGHINHFSWNVYKNCDDQEIIIKCIDWMKEVVEKEPTYTYLDTYAFLMKKSGNKIEAKRIALLAIAAAEKENQNTKSLKELIKKL